MLINGVNFPESAIAAFCKRNAITRLSLFGSILRAPSAEGGDGIRLTSGIDILVEFTPGMTPSLPTFAGMQSELRELLGREVQLCTAPMLSHLFRDRVLLEARPLHAA